MSDAAQNQHYVPKFILRNFLADDKKDRVSVFAKSTRRGFVTAVKNVMAERKFNDFRVSDSLMGSIEEGSGRIENAVLPLYRRILEEQRLSGSLEEKETLALFISFQMLRTRAWRDSFVEMEEQLDEHLQKRGASINQVEGYTPLTDDNLKLLHARSIKESLPKFTEILSTKDLLLLRAKRGRAFYLGDDPVVLYNDEPRDPFWGNIGLTVKGIQIYVPLSADMMLAAWCPSILREMEESSSAAHAKLDTAYVNTILSPIIAGRSDITALRDQIKLARESLRKTSEFVAACRSGVPADMTDDNMDFYNSMQVQSAREYVVCRDSDFRLARRFVTENGVKKRKLQLS